MIENCLDGRSGAELGVFAAGDAAVCTLSVDPADMDGSTCAGGVGKEVGAAGSGTQHGVELLDAE